MPGAKNIMVYEVDPGSQVLAAGDSRMIMTGGRYLPFLSDTATLGRFPSVTVDMGAVKFVCKGADVMRPGITKYAEFEEGGIVCVVEESRGKFIAVGRALVASSAVGQMGRGRVVRNIHYISDKFWQAGRSL